MLLKLVAQECHQYEVRMLGSFLIEFLEVRAQIQRDGQMMRLLGNDGWQCMFRV